MIYLIAFLMPPAVFLQSGKLFSAMINLVLCLTCIGLPFAAGWALFEAGQYLADQRNKQLVEAVRSRRRR